MIFRTADRVFALRFLRLLTTPWKKTGAYKAGIIDEKGKKIRKPKTGKEKDVYNLFHKLVFNLKRLLNKIPFGKSTLASYAAALWLIKEHSGLSDKLLGECLYEITGYNPCDDKLLQEASINLDNQFLVLKDGTLLENISHKRAPIKVTKSAKTVGTIFGLEIVEGVHTITSQPVLVCRGVVRN